MRKHWTQIVMNCCKRKCKKVGAHATDVTFYDTPGRSVHTFSSHHWCQFCFCWIKKEQGIEIDRRLYIDIGEQNEQWFCRFSNRYLKWSDIMQNLCCRGPCNVKLCKIIWIFDRKFYVCSDKYCLSHASQSYLRKQNDISSVSSLSF